MSTPIDQQQPPPLIYPQPPPTAVIEQAYTAHSGHGSVGPVIAVLAVITILGVIAGMIGRLCSGRTIMGHGHFDFEAWFETKCSACIDGAVDTVQPRPVVAPAESSGRCSCDSEEAQPAVEGAEEVKEEKDEQQQQHAQAQAQAQAQEEHQRAQAQGSTSDAS